VSDQQTLYINLYAAPVDWRDQITALAADGLTWERWEGQPIADQIKLHGCNGVPPDLPNWMRRP
jgi:hypothetical protein